MISNYFKIAYRNLLRHKGYAFINISGLAVGIGCCILITMYVQDELSYDTYNRNYNRVYRLTHSYNPVTAQPQPSSNFQVWGNAPVGPALQRDFPEVLTICQFTSRQSLLFQNKDVRFQEQDVFYIDSTAFDVFDWKLASGNPTSALVAPNSIVLSRAMAKKYFNSEDALGQQLVIDNGETYSVTGVLEDLPKNSHLRFDALISMSTFRKHRAEIFDWWGYVDFYTYFLVGENFDRAAFEAKLPAFKKRHVPNEDYTLAIESLPQTYLHSQAVRQPGTTGSLSNLYIFSTIAIFILLIACINFMNLSTARSMDRAKEVGIRKSVGANLFGLVRQFLSEALLLSLIASVFAIALVSVVLPAFNNLSGKELSLETYLHPIEFILVGGLTVVVGLLAGSYPALVLSGFKPALVLKGVFRNTAQGAGLRKGLVVFQFGLSVALIAGSLVVFTQLNHLRQRDLGFQKDQMLIIDFGWDGKVQREINSIKASIANVPSVISVSAQRTVPGGFFPKAYTEVESPSGELKGFGPDLYEVDYDFVSNFDMKIVAGRDYSRDVLSDSSNAMVINESAARSFGYPNPADIIGKKFTQWGKTGVIVGVVKNFNYRSLHHEVEPLTLRLTPQWSTSSIAVRLKSTDIRNAVAQIGKIWNQVAPQRPYLYSFLDDSFNQQYKNDVRFGDLFTVFAGLAIFIACFGLFGLTTYTVEQRTKEIGIRKVLGASVVSIVTLLSRDFVKLVVLAIAIALPLAYFAMTRWLDDFAYHVEPGLLFFVLPAIAVVLLALLVVSGQAIRTAIGNPVGALRNE